MAPKKHIYGVEIARLVLGYLLKVNKKLFKEFLNSSPFFHDIRDDYEEGDELDLNYYGKSGNYKAKSLQDVLEEYAHLSHILHCKIQKLTTDEQQNLLGRSLPEKFDLLLQAPPASNSTNVTLPNKFLRPGASAACQTTSELENRQRQRHQRKSADRRVISTQTEWTLPPFQDLNLTGSNSSPLPDVPTTPGTGLFIPRNLERNDSSRETPSSGYNDRQEFSEPMDVAEIGSESSKLARSMSCGDLPSEHGLEMKEARRKFFTPNKWSKEQPTDEFLMELLANRSIHERLAQSINHALAEISEECQMDDFVQNIIAKTTSDPTFDEIVNETLGSFDMAQFLRPKPRTDAGRPCDQRPLEEEVAPVQEAANAVLSATLVSLPIQTAEVLPYPSINYKPVDRNIYISDLNEKGDIQFYSNPRGPSPGVFLPPPPPPVTRPSRYRKIQPKPEPLKEPSAYNVVVCTPLMPIPVPDVIPTPKTAKRTRSKVQPETASRNTRSTRSTPAPSQTPLHEEEVPPELLIPATPGRVYTDDMPFLGTPQQLCAPPFAPSSPKVINKAFEDKMLQPDLVQETKDPTPKDTTIPNHVPEVTPHQTQQPRKRQTQSTPRRKSYIRTLEFETPQKDSDAKKCVTLPKNDAPVVARTPEGVEERKNKASKNERITEKVFAGKMEKLRKKELILDAAKPSSVKKSGKLARSAIRIGLSPKGKKQQKENESKGTELIATRTPKKNHLSGFWDPLKTVMGDSNRSELVNSTIDAGELASLSNTTTNGEEPDTSIKAWDSLLRNCVGSVAETDKAPRTLRRRRKIRPKNSPKKIKVSEPRISKPRVTRSKTARISPSKKHAKSTTKRSTYAISHGSSSAFETSSSDEDAVIEVCVKKPDNSEITPAKIDVPAVPAEETPFTKFFRENIDSVDIDLSMIQTPVFPPTPSIAFFQDPVTPLHEARRTDYSSGSSYYKPDLTSPVSGKEVVAMETVAEMEKSEEYLQDVSTVSGRNLVLTPDEKEVSYATKQSKITNYFEKFTSVASSPDKRPSLPLAAIQLSSDESLVSDQSTVVEMQTPTEQSQNNAEEPNRRVTSSVDVAAEKIDDETPEPQEVLPPSTSKKSGKKLVKEKPDTTFKPPMDKSVKSVAKTKEPLSDRKIKEIVVEGRKMAAQRKSGGKHMGMFKLQMIAQCEVKLSQNIPISASSSKPISQTAEEKEKEAVSSCEQNFESRQQDCTDVVTRQQDSTAESSVLPQIQDLLKRKSGDEAKSKPSVLDIAKKLENSAKVQSSNILEELEVKRQETLRKIKGGEGGKRSRKPLERPTKRVRVDTKKVQVLPVPLVSSTPTKSDSSRISLSVSDAEDRLKPESPIVCPSKRGENPETEKIKEIPKKTASIDNVPSRKSPEKILDARDKKSPGGFLPSFVDNGEFPELPLNTKKKIFVINFILERDEVRQYLDNKTDIVRLQSAHRAIFRGMFKWLKHPREAEVMSPKVQDKIKLYLEQFLKINDGLPAKNDRSFEGNQDECNSVKSAGSSAKRHSSKSPGRHKAAPLPLKKRKNNVHIAKCKDEAKFKSSGESGAVVGVENLVSNTTATVTIQDQLPDPVTSAHTLLQEIDVDRFLSRVHGHDSS